MLKKGCLMKVFISWSGTRSKEMANALRQWLPMVLQYLDGNLFVSDKDISAGERWAQAIAGELETSNFGIICITPENLSSEWILFESGALSKSMLDAKVIPLLFDLELSNLSGPLAQFQAQKVDMGGFSEVVRAINKVAEKPASVQVIDQMIPVIWPQLQTALSKISTKPPSEKHKRSQHEILEELVTSVRGISTRIREYDPEISEKERYLRRRRPRFHPKMIEEIVMMSGEHNDPSAALLLLSSFTKEDFPWLSEIILETYRESRTGDRIKLEKSFIRVMKLAKNMLHHPLFREFNINSKEAFMLSEELPKFLDIIFHGLIERNQFNGDVTLHSSMKISEHKNTPYG
jgi:hypothetical protein